MIPLLLAQDYEFRDPTRFGANEFTNQVLLHPLGLAAISITALLMLSLPKRMVIVPIVFTLCFIPSAQRILVFGIDFQFLRIIGVVALLRILTGGDISKVRWRMIDLCVLIMAFLPVLTTLVRGQADLMVPQLGLGGDLATMYLIGRVFLSDLKSWNIFLITSAVISIPVCLLFLLEKSTGRNLFSVFGGVPEITPIREGKLRAQGAFAHPIIAGVWWASMAPLFLSMAKMHVGRPPRKILAYVAILMSVVIVICCASSTPIGSMAVGIILWFCYGWRKQLARARWVILCGALAIHFVSQSGLHGLIFTRITLVSGSTGHHRYRLVDAALDRIPEWFFFGTRGTYHWGWGLDDVTCEYVFYAIRGGIVGLSCLVLAIALAIRNGYSMSVVKEKNQTVRFMGWGIAAAVATHAVSFLGVTYFGQGVFLFAATIGAAYSLRDRTVGGSTSSLRHASSPA